MPTYSLTAPNGKTYDIEGPEGASQDDVQAEILRRDPAAGQSPTESAFRSGVARTPAGAMFTGLVGSDVARSAIEHAPESAMKFGQDIVQPFIHPIETAENLKNLGHGVLQKIGVLSGKDKEQYADAVGKFLVDRYGSVDAVKKTMSTDPVGLLADVSMVLSGGGTAAARAPGVVGRIGEVASTVGRATDPLVGAGKVLQAGGHVAAETIGRYGTHTGGTPLKVAAQAGFEGGAKEQAFLDQLRGTEPMQVVVNEARGAVNALKQERGAEYRSGMHDVSKDKTVLDFNDIDQALIDATKVATYKGQVLQQSTQNVRAEIAQAIQKWKLLPPDEFHTVEGMDALKKQIGDIGGVGDKTKYGTPEHKVATDIYNAIKGTIEKQAPAYAKVMRGYEEASTLIQEIERTLSLKPNASVDTALGKLQATLRNNVNSRYGYRKDLAEFLAKAGAKNLMERLAGQALREISARGLGAMVGTEIIAAALGAVGFGAQGAGAGLLLALPFMSPRLMGEGARLTGKAARYAPQVRAGGQIGRQGGQLDDILSQMPQQPAPAPAPATPPQKQSSLNPDEGRVVSDVDTRPIAGQQYAMMDDDELRRSLSGRRPLLMPPAFGGGGGPGKPANQNVKAPPAANQNVLSPSSHQRPIPEQYKEAKSFLQRIMDNTKGMNREEVLASEPIWGGARQLSESGKMSFRDAFHLLTEQITGYGLTPQEWTKIAEQAMKYGIR